MAADEAVVYEAFHQLHERRGVDDALYARGVAQLGEQGMIELAGVFGYYSLLAMTMNLARTKTAGDDVLPLSGT